MDIYSQGHRKSSRKTDTCVTCSTGHPSVLRLPPHIGRSSILFIVLLLHENIPPSCVVTNDNNTSHPHIFSDQDIETVTLLTLRVIPNSPPREPKSIVERRFSQFRENVHDTGYKKM